MTTTINTGALTRLINQTKPHMAGPSDLEAMQVIRFETDGTHLYASATNRYTMGISRTRLTAADKPWSATIPQRNLRDLEAAARILGRHPVTLTRGDTNLELSDDAGTRILIGHQEMRHSIPDWRDVVLPALDRDPDAQRMSMTPGYFGAWKNLPGPVTMWSTGPNKPALIVAADFIGVQMPVRVEDPQVGRLQAELASWKPAAAEGETAVLEAA